MSIQFVSIVAYCGKIEQSISAPLRAGVREQCSAPLIKLNDIRDLFWLVNIIKPQAGDGKKLLCGRISQTITANNIEHRPPLTKMCGRCSGKFKWHRTDIRTKAAMATVLAMKNLLRAPGKQKKWVCQVVSEQKGLTHLPASCFWFLTKWLFWRFKSRF